MNSNHPAQERTDLNEQVIEANGLTLLPGVIDPQVHFRDPGLTQILHLSHLPFARER